MKDSNQGGKYMHDPAGAAITSRLFIFISKGVANEVAALHCGFLLKVASQLRQIRTVSFTLA